MKKALLIIIIIFVVLFYYKHEIKTPNSGEEIFYHFAIAKGEGVSQIADELKEKKLIKNELAFELYVNINGYRHRFLEGDYLLKGNLSIKDLVQDVMDQIESRSAEVSVSLIEGEGVKEMDEALAKANLIKAGELIDVSNDYEFANEFDFLADKPGSSTLEGYLYPDTYRFYANTTPEKIVAKMLRNFDDKLTPEMRAEIKKQGRTVYQVLTLASIVEKEMFGYESRRQVAGVFYNRLKIGMPLQSDATVNYITGKGMTRPTIADTKIDNRYNTYKYYGLPPGPICNPSIESIKAVIYPASNNYLYFLTTPDNQIIFSKTMDEHLKNQYKYFK